MSESTFDTVARHLALDRRTSLAALGAAILAVASRSGMVSAGEASRKARRKCKKQRKPCQAFVRQECGTDQECLAAGLPCCGHLARCKFAAFAVCVDEAFDRDM